MSVKHYTTDEGVKLSVGETKSKNSAHAHKEVARVAREAANELYDTLMFDNVMRGQWKSRFPNKSEKELRAAFVSMYWGKCLPFARATLAQLLRTCQDEVLKESIYEALCLDATLIKGRV